MAFVGILSQIKSFWSVSYSACVVYTKTIIPLSVGESDATVFLAKRGVMVPGVPRVDRGNWGQDLALK